MHEKGDMLFSFTVFPIGAGADVAGPVSEAVGLIADSGLAYQVTGASTLIEGRWTDVMPVIERCMHELTEKHDRVYASITVDYHAGETGRLKASVEAVEQALQRKVKAAP